MQHELSMLTGPIRSAGKAVPPAGQAPAARPPVAWHAHTLLRAQIFHQFSWYLEPLALIPQFVLLANRRGAYPRWVLAYLAMAGAEGLLDNWPLLTDPQESLQSNPYGAAIAKQQQQRQQQQRQQHAGGGEGGWVCGRGRLNRRACVSVVCVPAGVYAAWVQCGVLVLGAALLVVQAVRSRQQAGLNESANKPAFDQVRLATPLSLGWWGRTSFAHLGVQVETSRAQAWRKRWGTVACVHVCVRRSGRRASSRSWASSPSQRRCPCWEAAGRREGRSSPDVDGA